ncbi:glycosyltransferase family 2 protein [Streptacidiphilus pinicola]|uniref:Hyaluronan synthase n=1 Tax=Streptacidiphilus pinicola TaxID=2219663 RepID=A0A2X0K1V6_9ACTN|nr:glycosyltransferase [Streptacidiphilus pinicola]RAG81549.1 glycosyltransferase family 2 protein [Streptacidiphilus pinicola]
MAAPTARYGGTRRTILLAALPVAGFTAWAIWHLYTVARAFGGHGNSLAFAWAFSFLLLWWVPLSWMERPATTTDRQQRQLDDLVVIVQVPVYNEDEAALRACLQSLLDQTRLPDRVAVVDDGSTDPMLGVKAWFLRAADEAQITATWVRQANAGKRHAQTTALQHDDSDIIVTLDSDTVLDTNAIAEGLKPFADPKVTSVAGLVAVLNTRTNWLTFLTVMLYTPFTRGFRSAQSVLKRVTVNSGTLAFYRGDVIRRYLDSYAHETFLGQPMQMNDDSLTTFYGLLHGDAVHQPTSVGYTLVPATFSAYRRQQMRWMRGTFARTAWWWRYAPLHSPVFWMPLLEVVQLLMSIVVPVALLLQPQARHDLAAIGWSTLLVGVGVNYMISLRFFMLSRSDEPLWLHVLLFLSAPIAGLWRILIVKPMYLWAMCSFWRVGSWGTRAKVEVGLG